MNDIIIGLLAALAILGMTYLAHRTGRQIGYEHGYRDGEEVGYVEGYLERYPSMKNHIPSPENRID